LQHNLRDARKSSSKSKSNSGNLRVAPCKQQWQPVRCMQEQQVAPGHAHHTWPAGCEQRQQVPPLVCAPHMASRSPLLDGHALEPSMHSKHPQQQISFENYHRGISLTLPVCPAIWDQQLLLIDRHLWGELATLCSDDLLRSCIHVQVQLGQSTSTPASARDLPPGKP